MAFAEASSFAFRVRDRLSEYREASASTYARSLELACAKRKVALCKASTARGSAFGSMAALIFGPRLNATPQ